MRIDLPERVDPVALEVILRGGIDHGLDIQQVEVESQVDHRVHVVDFHVGRDDDAGEVGLHRSPFKRIDAGEFGGIDYFSTLAAHSQQLTGSPFTSTFVPSRSVRQKSLNWWIHTPWLNVFLGEPSDSR